MQVSLVMHHSSSGKRSLLICPTHMEDCKPEFTHHAAGVLKGSTDDRQLHVFIRQAAGSQP